jgi:heptosyltransferase-3
MIHLFRKLRALKIDLLYYLTPEGRVKNLIRHTVFFKLCGVKKIRAAPWSKDLRFPREVVPDTLWESEASRLLRTLDPSRPPGAPEPSDRVLDLTVAEQTKAQELLSELPAGTKFLTLSVGGKIPLNNWGDENWGAVLAQLSREMPQLGLVLVGSADERERNDRLAQRWAGPTLNSCGRLTPRETAALIQRAEAFVGHDTGTLHLAAAVGTKIVGVYSARNKPGKWYSDRPGDRFFYHKPPCFGCELELASACPNGLLCMTSHRPEEVAAATRARIEE